MILWQRSLYCRVKTDLTNVKYVRVAMACYTRSSLFHCLQSWATMRKSQACDHTWSFPRINAVAQGQMNCFSTHSDTRMRVQLGRKYCGCLHGRLTCDFNHLSFYSRSKVSENMWGPTIDSLLYSNRNKLNFYVRTRNIPHLKEITVKHD